MLGFDLAHTLKYRVSNLNNIALLRRFHRSWSYRLWRFRQSPQSPIQTRSKSIRTQNHRTQTLLMQIRSHLNHPQITRLSQNPLLPQPQKCHPLSRMLDLIRPHRSVTRYQLSSIRRETRPR